MQTSYLTGVQMTGLGKIVAAFAALAILQGCSVAGLGEESGSSLGWQAAQRGAVQTDERVPTHRWARLDASTSEYRFDNRRCVDEASIELGATAGTSPTFRKYRQCMEKQGYTLVSLAPAISSDRHP